MAKKTDKQLALASLKKCDHYILIAYDGERLFRHMHLGKWLLTFLGALVMVKDDIVESMRSITKDMKP